jgi:hypothetical protein
MSFFRQFPLTTYDLEKTGALTLITDLFRNVTSPQIKLDPTIAYTDYRIVNGARPDAVSQLLYNDTDYYWTFFIINDILKSGHASWPMSDSQMEKYLTQEYDDYSVIQMADVSGTSNTSTLVTQKLTDSTLYTVDSDILTADIGDIYKPCSSTLTGINFDAQQLYVLDYYNQTRKVMKYDPYMQQLWIVNSGSSDTFVSNLQDAGLFQFSTSTSGTPIFTVTRDSITYDSFCASQSPYVTPYVTPGRDAAHHYVFTPQIGDTVRFGVNTTYTYLNLVSATKLTGISGTVTDLIAAKDNAYGGIIVDPGTGAKPQYHVFTDPQGFLVPIQDVIQGSLGISTSTVLSPMNRVTAVSYAQWENDLNEKRSSIRVVNPTYIRAFAKQYRDLINA